MSIKRFATQRDKNEPEIVEALRKAGYYVRLQDEPCDLFVGRGLWHPVEIKAPPGARGGVSHAVLTKAQIKCRDEAAVKGCCFHVVRSPQDALDQLKECYREKQAKRLPDA